MCIVSTATTTTTSTTAASTTTICIAAFVGLEGKFFHEQGSLSFTILGSGLKGYHLQKCLKGIHDLKKNANNNNNNTLTHTHTHTDTQIDTGTG